MGAFEDGQSFLAGVLAKIPESLRAQVKDALEKPEAKDAVTLIGDGVLARSDYSKSMDKLKAQETELKAQADARLAELNAWYTGTKAVLDEWKVQKPEYDRLKAGKPDDDDEPPKPPVAFTKEDLQALIDESLGPRERGAVDVMAFLTHIGLKHLHAFGEPPDVTAITANPKLGKPIAGQPNRVFSLQDAYNVLYGEKVAANAKEADDKRINDEVEKRLKEKLSAQPFPLRGSAPAPSSLDELDLKDRPTHTVDSATALYESLQQGRGL